MMPGCQPHVTSNSKFTRRTRNNAFVGNIPVMKAKYCSALIQTWEKNLKHLFYLDTGKNKPLESENIQKVPPNSVLVYGLFSSPFAIKMEKTK